MTKDTETKLKRLTTDWEKIFTTFIANKGLSRIYEVSFQSIKKKEPNPVKSEKVKWVSNSQNNYRRKKLFKVLDN